MSRQKPPVIIRMHFIEFAVSISDLDQVRFIIVSYSYMVIMDKIILHVILSTNVFSNVLAVKSRVLWKVVAFNTRVI